jgi:hypothetical protein
VTAPPCNCPQALELQAEYESAYLRGENERLRILLARAGDLVREAHQHWANIHWPEDTQAIALLERALELLVEPR